MLFLYILYIQTPCTNTTVVLINSWLSLVIRGQLLSFAFIRGHSFLYFDKILLLSQYFQVQVLWKFLYVH